MRAARLLFPLLFLAASASALAQTTDPLFAGFRFAPQGPGSRPAGLGGAFVAVADGGKAAYFNPAGIALIPLTELELSTADPWLSLAAKSYWLRFAGYGTKGTLPRLVLDDAANALRGSLDAKHRELGASLAIAPFHNVKLGVTGSWSTLRLDGQRSAPGPGGPQTPAAVQGDNGHFRLTAGLLLTVVGSRLQGLPMLRAGLSYQPGFDWSAQMTEGSAAAPVRRTIAVRRPSLMTGGLAWYASDQWSFYAQGDIIRYGEVMDSLRRNVGSAAAKGFSLGDKIEPRLGSELALPLSCGCGIVKLRAGFHYRSPGTLLYSGNDAVLETAFARQPWRAAVSLGGSFFAEYFGRGLRLDVDSKDLFNGPALSFGVVLRY